MYIQPYPGFILQYFNLPPKSQVCDILCPLCKGKLAQRKALMEHIQLKHMEHLYGHLLGLDDDAVRELIKNNKLLTCEV